MKRAHHKEDRVPERQQITEDGAQKAAKSQFVDNRPESRSMLQLQENANAHVTRTIQKKTSVHPKGCGCENCSVAGSDHFNSTLNQFKNNSKTDVFQMQCGNCGSDDHETAECAQKHRAKAEDREVQLGQFHKEGSAKPAKRKTTARVEERLTRHINDNLRGQKSKAKMIKMKGQNVMWEVGRKTKAKQAEKGPRHVLMHTGGGASEDDPLDYFEDQDYGAMSETDSEASEDLSSSADE